jgi:hypothetical protein
MKLFRAYNISSRRHRIYRIRKIEQDFAVAINEQRLKVMSDKHPRNEHWTCSFLGCFWFVGVWSGFTNHTYSVDTEVMIRCTDLQKDFSFWCKDYSFMRSLISKLEPEINYGIIFIGGDNVGDSWKV